MNIQYLTVIGVVEWIDKNIKNEINTIEAAKISGYSLWHLQRIFLKFRNQSISSYIREKRLEMVIHELNNSNKKIIQISDECGFDSQQALCRIFTKKFGIPPTAYRKRYLKSS